MSLRSITLVGPRLADAESKTPVESAHVWTAELAVAYQGKDRQDKTLVNSTLGMRVVLQSPVPDVGRKPDEKLAAGDSHDVPLMSPQLLQLAAGPHPEYGALVHFRARANGMSSQYRLIPDKVSGPVPPSLGVAALWAVPLEQWPMPQRGGEIDVPRLRLTEGRLSVLIDARQAPGFLRLVPDPESQDVFAFAPPGSTASLKQKPVVRLESVTGVPGSVTKDRYIRLDLTPEGIEFDATLANPLWTLNADRSPTLSVRLRLAQKPDPKAPGGGFWALHPVVRDANAGGNDGYADIRQVLERIETALEASNTLSLEIDSERSPPPVYWPLVPADDLNLTYAPQATARAGWTLELRQGLSTMLAGDPDRDSALPSTTTLVADCVTLNASGTSAAGIVVKLRADRHRPPPLTPALAPVAPSAVPLDAPVVHIEVAPNPAEPTSLQRRLAIAPADELAEGPTIKPKSASTDIAWTLDENTLSAELVARYERAGVHPPMAADTYAYTPVQDGWLQWPVRLPGSPRSQAPDIANHRADAAPFDTTLVFELDAGSANDKRAVGGRVLQASACASVKVEALLQPASIGSSVQLARLDIWLQGCAGRLSGLLWFATSSPTPDEILPQLAGGPLSLQSAWLAFGLWKAVPPGHVVWRSGLCTPLAGLGFEGLTLTLDLRPSASAPVRTAVHWKMVDEMPVVTAMPMTRTSDSSPLPLSTRQLLPCELRLDRWKVELSYVKGSMRPTAVASTADGKAPELLHAQVWSADGSKPSDPWQGIPLVALTLPGIEFKPDPVPFEKRKVRLQFGLPVLDELWATARLPQVGGGAEALNEPATLPVERPTTLDLCALRSAWVQTRDRLMLSRTQGGEVDRQWSDHQGVLSIKQLFAGSTWSPKFELWKDVTIDNTSYPFGRYELTDAADTKRFEGASALSGLSGNFSLENGRLTLQPKALPSGDPPVCITGWAAALHPSVVDGLAAWRDSRGSITAQLPRAMPGLVVRDQQSALQDGRTWCNATLLKPMPIIPASGQEPIAQFWFRDLPLQRAPGASPGSNASSAWAFFSRRGGPQQLELAAGPGPEEFEQEHLPSSTYEWHFTPAAARPQPFMLDLAPLSFRPLRLIEVTVPSSGTAQPGELEPPVSRVHVLGTLALATLTAPPAEPDVFADDSAYATGSPVVLGLEREGGALRMASWGPASLNELFWQHGVKDPLRADDASAVDKVATSEMVNLVPRFTLALSELVVSIGPRDAQVRDTTRARLTLDLSGDTESDGRPKFKDNAASADVVLFGSQRTFKNGTATYEKVDGQPDLVVRFAFETPRPSAVGIALDSATFCVRARRLELRGQAVTRWSPEDSKRESLQLASLKFHDEMVWLNHRQPIDAFKIRVDHANGSLSVEHTDSAPFPSFTPVAGMTLERPVVSALWQMSFDRALPAASASDESKTLQHVFEASSALGLLDVQADDSARRSCGATGFRHEFRMLSPRARVDSRIEVDFDWSCRSRIEWPIDAVVDPQVSRPVDSVDARYTTLRLQACLLPHVHHVHFVVTRASLDTALLCPRKGNQRVGEVGLESAWALHGRADHEIWPPARKTRAVAWTAVEQVVIAGARALLEAAHRDETEAATESDTRAFAFAARYRDISAKAGDKAQPDPAYLKGGVGLRPYALAGFPTEPVAAAWLPKVAFQDGRLLSSDWTEALVGSGAGPVSIRVGGRTDQGFLLSLPWIATLTQRPSSIDALLVPFTQSDAANPLDWDVPDIDAACRWPHALSSAPALPLALKSDSTEDLRRVLLDALAMTRPSPKTPSDRAPEAQLRALMPVEQVFLRPSKAGTTLPVAVQPLWLRSLLTLKGLFAQPLPSEGEWPARQIVPSGASDGAACRVALRGPARAADVLPGPPAGSAQLIAVGSAGLESTGLSPSEMALVLRNGQLDTAPARSRLVARASGLMDDALAAVVLWRPVSARRWAWQKMDVPTRDDGPFLVIDTDVGDVRAFASPHLGWPSTGAEVEAAAGASLGMGEDRPFQDCEAPTPSQQIDVKAYGSGFSGRIASLSLPARAEKAEPTTASFYVHGTKTLFQWAHSVALAAPPARHLTPAQARLRLPSAADTHKALSTLDPKALLKDAALDLQPLIPPYIERTTYGSRPGAMQAEFDALAFLQWRADALDRQAETPACAGMSGPMLVRQQRSPRGVELPRLPVLVSPDATRDAAATGKAPQSMLETHGRRTFVATDDLRDEATRQARPFRVFDGVATVLRTTTGSLHVNVRQVVEAVPASRFSISLDIEGPVPNAPLDDLLSRMLTLGLLPSADQAPSASLSVGGTSAALLQAQLEADGLRLRLHLSFGTPPSVAANTVCRALQTADGDTPVVLTFTGINAAAPPPKPPLPCSFSMTAPGDTSHKLQPEHRHRLVFRLPVRPVARAAMQVEISTLVFGDPAYDRTLSGTGASAQQRDKNGAAWKLALDRTEYSLDTPILFAIGEINPLDGQYRHAAGKQAVLGITRIRGRAAAGQAEVPLRIAGASPYSSSGAAAPSAAELERPLYELGLGVAYALTLDRLQVAASPHAFDLRGGDRLLFSVTTPKNETISAIVSVSPRSVVPPAPAVYSLLAAVESRNDGVPRTGAEVPLHASRPMPTRIDFPDIEKDLALGHIRRTAIFEWAWPRVNSAAPAWVTLLKADSTGGAQLPTRSSDMSSP